MYGTPLEKGPFLFVVAICHFGMQTTGSILMRIRCFCVQRIIGGIPPGIYRVVLIVDSSSLR